MKRSFRMLAFLLSTCMILESTGMRTLAMESQILGQEKIEADVKSAETLAVGSTEDIASGEQKGISWRITAEGELIITGTSEGGYDLYAQWEDYTEQITSATVSANGLLDCSNLFSKCSNLTSVDLSGLDTSQVTDMMYMFNGCSSLESVDVSKFDTSQVVYATAMFAGCSSLSHVDVSHFNTGKMTDMNWMFYECSSLGSVNVTNFDTSQVTNMSDMFYGCTSLYNVDVTGFDTSQVTNMSGMFSGCCNLNSLDVSSFNTGRVTDMSYMFDGCSNLKSLDVSNFGTSQVTNMWAMFGDCTNLSSLDLSNFDTRQVTDMHMMFSGCTNLSRLDLSSFNTGQVTNMFGMFLGCSSLSSLDLSGFDASQATSLVDMFTDCNSLKQLQTPKNVTVDCALPQTMYDSEDNEYTYLPMNMEESILLVTKDADGTEGGEDTDQPGQGGTDSGEDEGSETDIASGEQSGMTWRITSEGELIVEGNYEGSEKFGYNAWPWSDYSSEILSAKVSVKGLKSCAYMFYDCNLTSIDFTGFDTSHVTSMSWMFHGCSSLSSVDVSGFDTSHVTDMSLMFDGCYGLSSVDVSGFDTSHVTSMSWMFFNCSSLSSLDLSGFDTSQVTGMSGMFRGCRSLSSLDVSDFDTSQVTDMSDMFYGCSSLKQLQTPKNVTVDCELPQTMYDSENNEYTYLPMNMEESILLVTKDADGTEGGEDTDQPGQGGTDSGEDEGSETDIASGEQSGVVWRITSEGELIITGTYNGEGIKFSWIPYEEQIKHAKVSVKELTTCYRMFADCSELTSVDLSEFDTSKVFSMGSMFQECSSLTSVDVSKFDTSNVMDMECMFLGCSSLESLDLSSFDTSQVTEMYNMFSNCSNLSSLNLSSFDVSQVTDMSYMLLGCVNLRQLQTPKNVALDCELPIKMYDSENNEYTYLPKNQEESILLVVKSSEGSGDVSGGDVSGGDVSGGDVSGGDVSGGDVSGGDVSGGDVSGGDISGGDVSGGDVSGGDVSGGDVSGGDVSGGDVSDGDVSGGDEEQKPGQGGTSDGEDVDKPGQSGTDDGEDADKPGQSGTDDGEDVDKPGQGGTDDGNDPGQSGTDDGEDVDKPGQGGTDDGNDPGQSGTDDGGDDDEKPGQDPEIPEEFQKGFWVAPVDDQVYTGKAVTPKVRVYDDSMPLMEGVDYTISYRNNIQAAEAPKTDNVSTTAPMVVVKGKGNYAGTISRNFTITAKELTKENTTLDVALTVEDGTEHKPAPAVTVAGKKLKAGTDYEVSYPDKVTDAYKKAGTYTYVVTGKGNYQGSVEGSIQIAGKDQIPATKLKVGSIAACTYEMGKVCTPVPAVTYNKEKLKAGVDYTFSYVNNDKAGKATVIITGLENAAGKNIVGSIRKTFTIKGIPMKKVKVDSYDATMKYTGKELKPAVSLSYAGKKLTEGTDYMVTYQKNTAAGKGTIVIKGCGGFTGSMKKTFVITPVDEVAVSFASGKDSVGYAKSGAKPAIRVVASGVTLTEKKDYTVTYKYNKKILDKSAEKAPVAVIKGKGNYKFQTELKFSITAKNLSEEDITVFAPDKLQKGKGSQLSIPVVTDEAGKKLKKNTDYKVEGYFVNGKAYDGSSALTGGTVVTVKVSGNGNYTGSTETTYKVVEKDIAKLTVVAEAVTLEHGVAVYTEDMLKNGAIKVTDRASGKTLEYGKDYIVTGYKNNTKKGKGTVTLKGISDTYGGVKNVKFKIVVKTMK